jgi:transposase
MARPYSEDLRRRVIKAVAGGVSRRKAAATFEVSVSTVIKWVQRWRATGSVAAKPMGGDNSSRLKGADAAWVLALVEAEPDLTLVEIRERLRAHGLSVGYGTVWRFLDSRDLRFKKRRSTPANRSALTSPLRG